MRVRPRRMTARGLMLSGAPFRTADTFVERNMRKPDMRLGDCVTLSALLAEVIADKAGDPGVRPYRDLPAKSGPPTPDFAIHPCGEVTRRLSQLAFAGM